MRCAHPENTTMFNPHHMSNNQKPVEIDLFSPIGITIALLITIPLLSIPIFALYFPKTWNATIIRLGLARFDDGTSNSATTEQSPSQLSRIFLGQSKTGYELWADKKCVYVKGLRESDLQRLNTNLEGFKAAIKLETGYKCVLFE